MARFVVPVVVLFALVGGYVAGQQPQQGGGGQQQPEPLRDPRLRRCVGVAATLHPTSGTQTIYRAFDDGTIEKITDNRHSKWELVVPRQ